MCCPQLTQYAAVDEKHQDSVLPRLELYLQTLTKWLIGSHIAIRQGEEYYTPFMNHPDEVAYAQADKIQFTEMVKICPHISNCLGHSSILVRERAKMVQGLALALFVNKLDMEDPSFINCNWSKRVVSIFKKGPRPLLTFSNHVKKSMECSYSLDQVPFDSTEFEDHLNTQAWFIDPYIFRETES